MKWLLTFFLSINALSGFKAQGFYSKISSDLFQTKDCPIFSISAEAIFLDKKVITYGQGWYFTAPSFDPTLSKTSLTTTNPLPSSKSDHYILTPYHVITGAHKIVAQCPYSSAKWELEKVGSSPTYDLSVLKIVRAKKIEKSFSKYHHQPLFRLDSQLKVSEINFPLDQKIQTTSFTDIVKSGNSGVAFVFVMQSKNNRYLEWISAGPLLNGLTYDDTSLAPFTKALTPLSGVQPGMSGGLLMTTAPKNQLLGMILGTKFNRGESLSAPFDEIVSQLPFLLKGQDSHRMKHQGLNSYIQFTTHKENNQLYRNRNLYQKNINDPHNREELIASDLCSSSQSSIYSSVGGGATHGDSGGASYGDSSGGASYGDSGISGGATGGDAGNNFLSLSRQFSITPIDWIEYPGFKRFHIRNVFQQDHLCNREGVIWLPLNKLLIGVKFKNFMMTINSVRDLIYLEEKFIFNKDNHPEILDLKSWIKMYGIFATENLNSGKSLIQNFCSPPIPFVNKPSSNGLLQGTNLLLYTTSSKSTETNATKLNFKRIYEDHQTLPVYKEFPQGFILGSGYFCEDNYLLVVGTNLNSTYTSSLHVGNSYAVKIEFHPTYFNFSFDTYYKDGEDQNTHPEMVHKNLKKERIPYSNLLNHFFEVDGFKFYLRMVPEQSTMELSLIGLPKNDHTAKYLMASKGEAKIPLAGFNFIYTFDR